MNAAFKYRNNIWIFFRNQFDNLTDQRMWCFKRKNLRFNFAQNKQYSKLCFTINLIILQINECGVCYGGTTGLPSSHGEPHFLQANQIWKEEKKWKEKRNKWQCQNKYGQCKNNGLPGHSYAECLYWLTYMSAPKKKI